MNLNYPVMLYDGDCKFCKRWIERWAGLTEDRVIYLPYQENLAKYPQVSKEDCAKAVQFIEIDNTVYTAAEAVFRSLLYSERYAWVYGLYKKNKLFSSFAEWLYKVVAKNRDFLSKSGM